MDVAVGTPAQQMHLLLRPDRVLAQDSAETSMRVFSQEAMESTTVFCATDGSCEDVILVHISPAGRGKRQVARFSYRHAAVEAAKGTVASSVGSVDGELSLREGHVYWMTATHLCYADSSLWRPEEGPPTAVARSSPDGFLIANRSSLRRNSGLADAPAASPELTAACESEDVRLFPAAAANEALRLSISDSSVYNSEPESVKSRRTIVEIGSACANRSAAFERQLMLYNLDCAPYSSCVSRPNLPFRRVASSSVCLVAHPGGAVEVSATRVQSLDGLPKLAESTDAFLISLVKLMMITLAAAVVYVRSKRFTASSSWLVKHCISTASVRGQMTKKDHEMSVSRTEDRLVGILAFFSRAAIAVYRIDMLAKDDQLRVCVTELAASTLSAIHLLLRYHALERNDELPISKLGGSTAVMDSTAAVMMAFAEPPSLVSSTGKFDPTARMLVALLISIIAVTRCAFSASCCGVMWEAETDPSRWDYSFKLMYSGVVWNLQCVALGVLMSDLFVVPSAYSMSRSTDGSSMPARVLLFLAFVCAGMPRVMTTIRHVMSSREHVD